MIQLFRCCAECKLFHQAPGGHVGPGGWGPQLAVLLHHQEGPDHRAAHHTGWEAAGWVAWKRGKSAESLFFRRLSCFMMPDVFLPRAVCQLLWLSDHLGQVLQGVCLCLCMCVLIYLLPSNCVALILFSLTVVRKTWLAKGSPSGCGWITSLTWWRSTSWHCGMKGKSSRAVHCVWIKHSKLFRLLFWKRCSLFTPTSCGCLQLHHGLHQQREGEGTPQPQTSRNLSAALQREQQGGRHHLHVGRERHKR